MMKELAIKRELNEETRKETVWCLINGAVECFSLHITGQGEVILTDHSDYTKIYSVKSLDFHRALESSNNDMQFDNISCLSRITRKLPPPTWRQQPKAKRNALTVRKSC